MTEDASRKNRTFLQGTELLARSQADEVSTCLQPSPPRARRLVLKTGGLEDSVRVVPSPGHPHANGVGGGAELVLECRGAVQHALLGVVDGRVDLHLLAEEGREGRHAPHVGLVQVAALNDALVLFF